MKQKESCSARLGRVGGQAVLEGVMMKSGDRTALAVRDEAGEIRTSVDTHTSVRKKYKFLNIPLVRGVVNFVETMILSYNTLMQSADMLGIDDAAEEFSHVRERDRLGNPVPEVSGSWRDVEDFIEGLGRRDPD